MNDLQIFSNEEFGSVRTITNDNEPMFCLGDLCRALDLTAKGVRQRLSDEVISTYPIKDALGRMQNALFVNEDGLYDVILESRKDSAKKFRKWVTSEVLPSIRKTGGYNRTMTTAEQIRLLAQGSTELSERIDRLENDMPLYGCEIEEVQKHVRKKGIEVLGGKNSNAYKDGGIRSSVYSDIYKQLKREFGCVATYKSIKRKYLANVHEFIDCYELPTILTETVNASNVGIAL